MLGAQWSSSNMPRYASNLSFNPLEPLKPSTTSSINATSSSSSSSSISKSELNDAKIPAKIQPDVIPEVEFDWNSSGLVNPLDGKFFLYFLS